MTYGNGKIRKVKAALTSFAHRSSRLQHARERAIVRKLTR